MDKAKPFGIPKRAVWEAYKRVKENHGAAGVDGQSIADFEENLSGNLFKIWNRMCSGSYQPPPVLRVEIPKASGVGVRPLGIPTVADRIAQTVAKNYLEPILEAVFDEDSYGYRPRRYASVAIATARARCWRYNWVLEFDIRAFFDNLDHDLLLRAVRRHTDCKWLLLYVKRWLTAPVQLEGGGQLARDKGTPQGGVISPLLANRYMNRYLRYWKQCAGERQFAARLVNYADDFVILSRGKANEALAWTRQAMTKLKLEINETKTCVRDASQEQFDFLGYSFGLHYVKRTGKPYLGASASSKSVKRIKAKVSETLRPQSGPWEEVRDRLNRMLVGWEGYFHHGSKRKSYRAVNAHVRTTVRNFLQRRHKVSSRGTRQFSHTTIFTDLRVHEMGGAR